MSAIKFCRAVDVNARKARNSAWKTLCEVKR